MKNKGKQKLTNYLFLLPAVLIYSSVIVVPTVYSFVISMFKWNGVGTKTFIGLKNYKELLFSDEVFMIALKNNGKWILLTLVFMVSIALFLAMLLNSKFIGRTFFRGLFYFPSVLSPILVAIVWSWIYNPTTGFANEFLRMIGLGSFTSGWTSDPAIALYCVFVAACWQGIGQPFILFLSGLQTVSPDVLEAADIDGAGMFKKFIHVTIPSISETFIMVFATLIIAALKVYDIIFGLTGGGPNNSTETLATYMYSQTFMYNNVGKGAAVACLMLIMMLIIIIPYVLFTTRED